MKTVRWDKKKKKWDKNGSGHPPPPKIQCPFQPVWIHSCPLYVLSKVALLLAEIIKGKKKKRNLQLGHHRSPAELKPRETVELVKSCIGHNFIDCPGCGLSYSYAYDMLIAMPMPFLTAPQMLFLFLFSRFLAVCALALLSCSQGLSSFSSSICSHLPLNSSPAPLLQPGQHCTSFQSLFFFFKKKIKYMKSEWLQNHILVLSLASQSTIVVQRVYRALYQVIGYYLLDCSSGTKNSVLVTTLFHVPPLYKKS